MTDKSTSHGKLAEKLAKFLEEAGSPDDPHVFDKDEVETLQAVIAFVDKLRALKFFGKWAMYLVVAVGTIIVNWERIKVFFSASSGS